MQINSKWQEVHSCYEQANQQVHAESGALISIWDGIPNIRPRSTAQVIEKAKKMVMPVFWINPADPIHAMT